MDDSFHDSAYPFAVQGNDAHRDRILPRAKHGATATDDASNPDAERGHNEPLNSGAIHRQFGRSPARRSCVGTLLTTPPPPAITAQITARASGHCEVMAPACTYEQALIFLRRRRAGESPRHFASPADGIAACRNCLDLIEHTDIPTALDLGYLVDARTPTTVSAMLWRQHRWVYLDIRGRIHDAVKPEAPQRNIPMSQYVEAGRADRTGHPALGREFRNDNSEVLPLAM